MISGRYQQLKKYMEESKLMPQKLIGTVFLSALNLINKEKRYKAKKCIFPIIDDLVNAIDNKLKLHNFCSIISHLTNCHVHSNNILLCFS